MTQPDFLIIKQIVNMKKAITTCMLCACLLLTGACTSDNSAGKAAEKAIEMLQKEDFQGYNSMLYLPGQEKENNQQLSKKKELITEVIQGYLHRELERKGGIKSYKVLNETQNGNKAEIRMEISYGNGDTDEETISLIKSNDNKWLINLEKNGKGR